MIEVHVWVVVFGAIICALLGALSSFWLTHLKVVDRVSRVEGRVDNLEQQFGAETQRNDYRIDHVREAVAEVLEVAKEVLKQNTVLIAEIRSDRRGNAS